MAKHEFGIMKNDPVKGRRYDNYEPQKYDCISVDDEYIERIDAKLTALKCYAHTLDVPIDGLAYCGITLIPPEAIEQFISLIESKTEMNDLRNLLCEALKKNRFVIHFGCRVDLVCNTVKPLDFQSEIIYNILVSVATRWQRKI